jgi:glyoxylase-like metal-dependent hydrolase (beta-lactamase superfamily II)
MQDLMTFAPRRVAADATLIGNHLPIPGLGVLACNAYLIHSTEPVLVDTGIAAGRDSFLDALRASIDPADLRWIWITHMDPDHVGNLAEVLAMAPKARVVTNFLGMGKMGLLRLPQERAYLLNPGQSLEVGDRRLLALRPPVYDAPETTALFDTRARVLYAADCFGSVLEHPAATAEDAGAALREGLVTWTSVDAPWLALADTARVAAACADLVRLAPAHVVSSHAPPARGTSLRALIDHLLAACDAPPFIGPDQAQLDAAMALREAA